MWCFLIANKTSQQEILNKDLTIRSVDKTTLYDRGRRTTELFPNVDVNILFHFMIRTHFSVHTYCHLAQQAGVNPTDT